MKAPHTVFSTELRGRKRLLKFRLEDLFAAPRRRGVFPPVSYTHLTLPTIRLV